LRVPIEIEAKSLIQTSKAPSTATPAMAFASEWAESGSGQDCSRSS
jgi:hypothetical protein